MKFTVAASYLLAATAAFAVISTEGASLRGKSLFQTEKLMKAFDQSATTGLHRHLEEENDNDNEDEDDAENDEDDAENDEDEADEEEQDENADEAEEAEEVEAEEESDDYTFYDDEALQNCEDGDEDCEMAAEYAAYDDEYLANCEEDDEECNDAVAYMTAKQNAEDEANSAWNVKNISEKYNSMSKSSKIWTIILAVWFALLAIATCFFCCKKDSSSRGAVSSGKSGSSKKSLRQSLMGGSSKKESSRVGEEGEEEQRGRSKFRIFGRKGNKNKRSSSKGTVE